MKVSLTPELEKFVRRTVASGLYNSASEVVDVALRLLVEREASVDAAGIAAPQPRCEVRRWIGALEGQLRAKGTTSLSVFGSTIHGAAQSDSDVDVLIDVDANARFSLVTLASVKYLLEEQLGRVVNVVTGRGIEPAIQARVFAEADLIF